MLWNEKWKKRFVYCGLVLLLSISMIQCVQFIDKPQQVHDARMLLFQVSVYQLELLNRSLQKYPNILDADSLVSLEQSLFTIQYVHDRVVLAYGEQVIAPFTSLVPLTQLIRKLQLSNEFGDLFQEKNVIALCAKSFGEILSQYRNLISSQGQIISSQNEKWSAIDRKLCNLLKKELLNVSSK